MTHLIPDGELIDAKSTVFAQGDYRAMFRVSVWLTEEGVHEHHDQQGVEHSAGFLTAYHRALRRSSDRDHHIEAFRELAFVGDGVVPLGLRQRILLSRTPLATQDCLVDLAEQLVINLSPPPPLPPDYPMFSQMATLLVDHEPTRHHVQNRRGQVPLPPTESAITAICRSCGTVEVPRTVGLSEPADSTQKSIHRCLEQQASQSANVLFRYLTPVVYPEEVPVAEVAVPVSDGVAELPVFCFRHRLDAYYRGQHLPLGLRGRSSDREGHVAANVHALEYRLQDYVALLCLQHPDISSDFEVGLRRRPMKLISNSLCELVATFVRKLLHLQLPHSPNEKMQSTDSLPFGLAKEVVRGPLIHFMSMVSQCKKIHS